MLCVVLIVYEYSVTLYFKALIKQLIIVFLVPLLLM